MNELIILRGLPGSGKSTFAKKLAIGLDAIICEADSYFYDKDGNYNFDVTKLNKAHAESLNACLTAMVDGKNVIVSNTSTTDNEFKAYIDLATLYGYTVTSLIVENRHGNSSIHNVPSKSMDRMKQRFSIKL
jgi:predicted kinase